METLNTFSRQTLKYIFAALTILFFADSSFAQMPAAITIDPPDATAYDELTLTFDPAEACFFSGNLEGLDYIAIHSGVSFDNGEQWQYIVEFDSLGENGQTTLLYPTGDGKFSITYIPFEFYGFPNGATVTEICAVFNNGTDWLNDGRDFDSYGFCIDFFIPISIGPSCLPEGIAFSSQSEIDNFQSNYPYCTEIEGPVYIQGEDISSLAGLDVLTSIGGGLTIQSNEALEDLSGLDSLNNIESYLWIRNNTVLNSLTGLENISIVNNFMAIYDNPALTDLTGLDNLHYVAEDLFIGRNEAMTSLNGLNNLDSVGLGLDIWRLPLLTDLTALENFTTNRGFLWISEHESLTSLSGLENLSFIGDFLRIHQNPLLTDISALENVVMDSVSDLYIYENESLSVCGGENFCDFLADPPGSINIYNNAEGCNNPVEIAEACGFEISCLPHGNYYFTSQIDVDAFQSLYPDCNDLNGSVWVIGAGIAELDGLGAIHSIEESLRISETELLGNLSGLDNLTSIGWLYASYNLALNNFTGLDQLTNIDGGISLSDNLSLTDLSGLEKVQFLGDRFYARGNEMLINLNGLDSISYIAGDLDIRANASLLDFTGLNKLETVGGNLILAFNDQMQNLVGLEKLTSIEGRLEIGAQYFGTAGNPSLISLDGLENLETINGDLIIARNYALENILALDNLQAGSIANLTIIENYSLSSCEAKAICDYLAQPGGIVTIYDNSTGCNNTFEIEVACDAVSINETSSLDEISVYPNPSSSFVTFEVNPNMPVDVIITIYNQLGEQLELMQENNLPGIRLITWDTQLYPTGIYYYNIHMGKQKASGKIIVAR